MAEELGGMARDALDVVNGGGSVGGASSLVPDNTTVPEPIKPIQSATASELSPDDGSGAITDGLKAPDQNALANAINAAKSEAMKRMLRGMSADNSASSFQSQPASAVKRLASTVANDGEPVASPSQAPAPQAEPQPTVTMGRSIFGGRVPTYTRKDGVIVEFGDGFDPNDREASAKAVGETNKLIDRMHELYEEMEG